MLAELLTLVVTYIFSPIDTILNFAWAIVSKVTLVTLGLIKMGLYILFVLYLLKYGVGSLYAKILLDRYFLYFLNSFSLIAYKVYRLGVAKSIAVVFSRAIYAVLDIENLKSAVYS